MYHLTVTIFCPSTSLLVLYFWRKWNTLYYLLWLFSPIVALGSSSKTYTLYSWYVQMSRNSMYISSLVMTLERRQYLPLLSNPRVSLQILTHSAPPPLFFYVCALLNYGWPSDKLFFKNNDRQTNFFQMQFFNIAV